MLRKPHLLTSFHPYSTPPSAVHSNTASVYSDISATANSSVQITCPVPQGILPCAGQSGLIKPPFPFSTGLSFSPSIPHSNPSLPQHPYILPSSNIPYTLATAAPPTQPSSAVHRRSPVSAATLTNLAAMAAIRLLFTLIFLKRPTLQSRYLIQQILPHTGESGLLQPPFQFSTGLSLKEFNLLSCNS